jgi:hypothetical protein
MRFGLSRQASLSVAMLTLVSTCVCWLAYLGPYRWFSELQVRVVGANYLGLTVLLTAFGIGLMFLSVAQLARRAGLLNSVALSSRRARSASAYFFSKTRVWLAIATVGSACVFLGARELRAGLRGRSLERMQASALEAALAMDAQVQSAWLEVQGKPFEAARIRSEPYTYVPLVSPSWEPGRAVAVVLKLDANHMSSLGGHVFRGTRDFGRLPVLVRGSYGDMGFDVRRAIVLEVGTTPADRSGRAGWLLGIGGVFLAAGALGTAVRLRAAARGPRAWGPAPGRSSPPSQPLHNPS